MTTQTEQKAVLEGLLFIVGEEGLKSKQAAEVLQIDNEKANSLLREMKAAYQINERGIELVEIAGGFRFTTKPEHHAYYQRLLESPPTSALSQAALETLAIVAYKQPITRAEIEDIRGVKTEKPLQTLATKQLIKEAGRADGTGRAILYGTTKKFLEYFGLNTTDELPHLPEQLEEDADFEEEADLFFEKVQDVVESNQ